VPILTWNETRDRALRFSRAWAKASHEEQDKQTFWNEFFECFGIPRKSVAVFEHAIANAKGNYSFLDLFWPGMLLIEHKSRGASLSKAESQAFKYLEDLAKENRHDEMPRYIVLCDFVQFALYDLDPENESERLISFPLDDLHKNVRRFAFIRGEKPVKLNPEDEANLKATKLLADLHDALEATGFKGHQLERLMVRILFCLFAEDTGIFDAPGCFQSLIERSKEDGSDLGPQFAQLFQVLNTPPEKRQRTLDEDLATFPYVNGGLFGESISIAAFNSDHRKALLACCRFQWAKISPAVFGSLFQGIMDDRERRQAGAHYTSERDIMKLIRSLFLDDLRTELDSALSDKSTARKKRLQDFQKKLRSLRFLDPACGCGNFLILAYRELRRLEKEALIAINTNTKGEVQVELTDIRDLAQVDVDQFYGIEIGEWPARIAEVGLWLTDHQSNVELAEALGRNYRRLPLKATPRIEPKNSLQTKWEELLPPSDNVFVLGNPPFVGKKEQTDEQKADMHQIWGDVKGAGILDYVTCWYRKATQYIKGTAIRCAFVSTNSITQGEQAGVLWPELFKNGSKLHFAHRTFAWKSEARGMAHVHVVIVGFGVFDIAKKRIFDYESEIEPVVSTTSNISPYLIPGRDVAVRTRTKPINGAPPINYGSMMIDKDRKAGDDEGLILSKGHKDSLLREDPTLAPYIPELVGGDEFLNGTKRWCLWLVDAPPERLRNSPSLRKRIEGVRSFRQKSNRPQTRALASVPTLFGEIRQPTSRYLLFPKVSSETRQYIPIGFLPPDVIASGSALVVADAMEFHLGILSSAIHNSWMKCVAGRMKSDYQYSSNIVYNNFPWPESVSDKDRANVERCAQAVLDARARFRTSTLADLYDPLAMPSVLFEAHGALDRAVDRCYRKESFKSDRERVEHLFSMYERLTAPLLQESKGWAKGRRSPS